jgi:hypothetical protein
MSQSVTSLRNVTEMDSKTLQKRSLEMILIFSLLVACDTIDERSKPVSICGTALPGAYQSKYRTIMEEMHRDMDRVTLVRDDKINFLRQMIPHHQGAIEMSELIIESTNDRRIINIAQGIITEQRNEIAIMNYLIQELQSDTIAKKQ